MPEFKKRPHLNRGGRSTHNRQNDRSQKELYAAECNNCRKRCEVPFRPNGRKPVYCSDCFSQTSRPSYSEPREQPSHSQAMERQLDELKRKIDVMNETLTGLTLAVDTFNRATALTKEIRKHFPAVKPADPPKVSARKTLKKPARSATKTVRKTARKDK